MRRAVWIGLASALCACQGTIPKTSGDPAMGYGAVLTRARVTLPSGETFKARLALNLESEADQYTLPFLPGRTQLLVVEPGTYKLHPTRGPFGVTEKTLQLVIENRAFRVPFPRDILRKDPVVVKPHKVAAIGILDVVVDRVPGERRPTVTVRLDDSPEARRELIEEKISHMLDPKVPLEYRDNAVAWTQALDQALVQVQEESGKRAPFKKGSW